MRTIHQLEQGSESWKAHRGTPGIFNASEISIINGTSSYVTRSEFLKRKATGIDPEYDNATLARFAAGHINEAKARPLAESIIDDDLSAMVMTDTIDGILFSVSLDGITQGYDTTFEHKSLNIKLADSLDAGVIPAEYHPQMEVGLMVSGATRCLFMASKDGDPATAKHAWYEPNPSLRPKIVAACKQFAIDLNAYEHVPATVAPVAATIEALPALLVLVEGKVLATNLDAFKLAAQAFIDGIKTELVNDQDFADADKMVKFLKDGEDRLALAKQQALAQTASIDELFRTVDAISEQMRSKRLALDKLVKAEKDNRRIEIIRAAQDVFMAHIDGLNKRVGGLMPRNVPSFADAIKGLKSLDSMRDKVDAAIANEKITASEIADTIDANRFEMTGDPDWSFLFPDFAAVCTKARDDFTALLVMRIAKHNEAQAAKDKAAKDAEDARVAAAVEAERKAGEARAAAAVEAARLAEVNRIAEAAQSETEWAQVQRGKAAEATHAEPQATASPQAPEASTPPTPEARRATPEEVRAAVVESGDTVREYLNSLPISETERTRLRPYIMGFVQFTAGQALKVAA